MGCIGLALAGLLALAIPASIAPASLVGAYVVIAILAAIAAVALSSRRRRRMVADVSGLTDVAGQRMRSRRSTLLGVVGVAIVYAAIVTAIHLAA